MQRPDQQPTAQEQARCTAAAALRRGWPGMGWAQLALPVAHTAGQTGAPVARWAAQRQVALLPLRPLRLWRKVQHCR